MYVCMYVFMHGCMYACMYVCIYVCMYVVGIVFVNVYVDVFVFVTANVKFFITISIPELTNTHIPKKTAGTLLGPILENPLFLLPKPAGSMHFSH